MARCCARRLGCGVDRVLWRGDFCAAAPTEEWRLRGIGARYRRAALKGPTDLAGILGFDGRGVLGRRTRSWRTTPWRLRPPRQDDPGRRRLVLAQHRRSL